MANEPQYIMDELNRILTAAGVVGRVEGRKVYVTPAEFSKLNRWAGETFERDARDPVANFEVIVEREAPAHGE